MTIQVKILNGKVKKRASKLENKPKILTSQYVRELNKGISARIIQRQISSAPDTPLVRKRIR